MAALGGGVFSTLINERENLGGRPRNESVSNGTIVLAAKSGKLLHTTVLDVIPQYPEHTFVAG
jgi:hypothetical protein